MRLNGFMLPVLMILLLPNASYGQGQTNIRPNELLTVKVPIQGIAVSASGQSIAALQAFGISVDIYKEGSLEASIPQLRTNVDPSIEFLDDHRLITSPAIGSPEDTLLDVWELGKEEPIISIKGDNVGGGISGNEAQAFCLSRDKETIAAITARPLDQFLAVVSALNWGVKYTTLVFHPRLDTIISLACSPHGNLIALGSVQGSVYLFDKSVSRIVASFQAYSAEEREVVSALRFSPDGLLLATGPGIQLVGGATSSPSGVKVWALKDRSLVISDNQRGPIGTLSWSADSKLVAIARNRRISVLSVLKKRIILEHAVDAAGNAQFSDPLNRLYFSSGRQVGFFTINDFDR